MAANLNVHLSIGISIISISLRLLAFQEWREPPSSSRKIMHNSFSLEHPLGMFFLYLLVQICPNSKKTPTPLLRTPQQQSKFLQNFNHFGQIQQPKFQFTRQKMLSKSTKMAFSHKILPKNQMPIYTIKIKKIKKNAGKNLQFKSKNSIIF